ncbi:unnamed protein product [Ciceribacter sp. T2.26MG-112.2]|uniref:hypothetical protein n=1 Tax=Ciceribacter sp. T2.26MG-112.2 TaxID=3137154 RepID=UPI000E168AB3|nr:hypothetical protein [Ciceribacter naphthalenivorans]SSC72752.1 unnamed protein product [Ciceribacter naphthalenivorans]
MLLQRLWDYISHARYRIALRARLIIDILIFVTGVVVVIFGGSGWSDIVGAITTLVGGLLLLDNLRTAWNANLQTRVVENEDFFELIKTSRLPKGFRLQYGALGATDEIRGLSAVVARPYISSQEVNGILDSSRNPVVLDPDTYQIPASLQAFRIRCINIKKPNRNDPKLGLRTDVTVEALTSRQTFTIQKTDYFSGAATNEMAAEQFESVPKTRIGRPTLTYAVSDLVVQDGELLGLSESALSNHIGVSTIVLTADNYVVIQDQGPQAVSGNETAVGASGSLDLKDVNETTIQDPTLQGLVRFGMEREAKEELSASFNTGRKNTVLTGYARYLVRGGKPEFFGISRTTSNLAELKPTRPDIRFVSGIRGRAFEASNEGLIRALEQLLEEGTNRRRRYSLSMVVSLRLALSYLSANELKAKI